VLGHGLRYVDERLLALEHEAALVVIVPVVVLVGPAPRAVALVRIFVFAVPYMPLAVSPCHPNTPLFLPVLGLD
jgi:hypothetical protein